MYAFNGTLWVPTAEQDLIITDTSALQRLGFVPMTINLDEHILPQLNKKEEGRVNA